MTDNRPPSGRPRLARCLRPGLAGLAVVALAAAPACGDDEGDDAGTDVTTTTEPPATTSATAPPTPEEEAEAVYLEFVEVVERLSSTEPDPHDPDLSRLAVDPVLSSVQDSLTTQRAENQLWRKGDRTSHDVSEPLRTADGISLMDCLVENDDLIDQDDGLVVRSTPLTTRELDVLVVESAHGWAVSEIDTSRKVEGEVACDV
jgi:hypothetical protein